MEKQETINGISLPNLLGREVYILNGEGYVSVTTSVGNHVDNRL